MLLGNCRDTLTNAIMENGQDIISVLDLNYNYRICNRAFLKLLNLPHETEVLGKNLKQIIPFETANVIEKYFDEVVKTREPDNYTFILQINDKNVVLSQLAIPFIENGEITGILAISKDITVEENLKQKLLDMVCKLNETLEIKKKLESQKELFMATLTHDLKNPVQAQLMSLKMLKNGTLGTLTSEQNNILDILLESSEYMQQMLFTILHTYKCDNGIIELNKQNIYVDELMKNCINEMDAFSKSKNIKIIYRSKVVKFFADPTQIRRVISNIISNAIKYSDKNSELSVDICEKSENIVFNFTNTGTPIPKNISEHIFDKYVSGYSGVGLGLYFSKKVIEAHCGKIYLTVKDKITTFTFELPINNRLNNNVKW